MKDKQNRMLFLFYTIIFILLLILIFILVKNIITNLNIEKKDELAKEEKQDDSKYTPLIAEYSYISKESFDFTNYKTYQTDDKFVKLSYPENFSIEFLMGDECNKYIGLDSRCIILKGADIGYLRIQYVKGMEEEYGKPGKFSGHMDQVGYVIDSINVGKLFRNNISNYTYYGDLSSINVYFVNEIFKETQVSEEFDISSFGTGTNWLVKKDIGVSIVYHLSIVSTEVPNNQYLSQFDQILSTLEIDFSVDPFQ